MLRWLLVISLLAAGCAKPPAPPVPPAAAYVDSKACAACHAAIAATYRQTAMARAFTTAKASEMRGALGQYQHLTSGRAYSIFERGGRYFQSRTEDGQYAIEREIHYIMGSGEHARSFLHRTPQGRLVELPLGWYAEGGGKLAMSPGYDRPDPLDFRRKISHDCMFCHNAYPAADAAPASEPVFPASLPEGIDCQRCHGPGSLHVAAGGKGGIVNPAKLDPERAMEVCMQCHLETTSRPLPNSLIRFGRGAYSYRPGEPLADFVLHFDHAKGAGREGKFEIVNSVYRLRQSRCYLESQGKLGCTSCHNPHEAKRGAAALQDYARKCQNCHRAIASKSGHPRGADCAGCHMPKRRTEDVVHAVMTDHKIVRRPPPGNLLASRAEIHEARFIGDVALYYPPVAKDQELYLGVAQVVQQSNLAGGIQRLESVGSKEPKALYALAQAYLAQGQKQLAEARYRHAVAADPAFAAAWRGLGEVSGSLPALEKARDLAPHDAGVWHALGLAYRQAGRNAEALAALDRAIAEDADFPAAHNALGGLFAALGDHTKAEAALREALRHQPDYAEAHENLGRLLAAREAYANAEFHLRAAVRWRSPGGWRALGEVQSLQGKWPDARKSFTAALEAAPQDWAAWLGLGTAQAALGYAADARVSLRKAATGGSAAVRQEALQLLGALR